MKPHENSVIDNYIQRVTQLSQSHQRIPTTKELEKIAAELGITAEEIQAAQQESQNHFVRSQGYMRLRRWDDAINELQEAVVFNPSNLDMLLALARAYLGRWREKHLRSDEENIRFRIRQCLEIKPDTEEALNLLFQLDRSLKIRELIVFATVVISAGSFLGIILSLPPITQKIRNLWQYESRIEALYESRVEALEKQFNQKLQKIKEEQKQKQFDFQREQDRYNRIYLQKINQLETDIERLEKELELLKQQNQENYILNQLENYN